MYPNPATYPQDNPTTAKQAINRARVEIQRDRGILYVYREDGKPLLKVTGLPGRLPDLGATNTNSTLKFLQLERSPRSEGG